MNKKATIPAKAKRVFKGELFDVYEWQQKMFDGSFKRFERIKRADSIGVIAITKDKKIIILKQKQPDSGWFLSLPGGRADKGEMPLKTAKRELKEETGYAAKRIKQWKVQCVSSKVEFKVYTYIAQDCEKKDSPQPDAGEKIKVRLLSFNQFLKLSDNDNFVNREVVIHLLRARLDKKVRKQFYKELFNN